MKPRTTAGCIVCLFIGCLTPNSIAQDNNPLPPGPPSAQVLALGQDVIDAAELAADEVFGDEAAYAAREAQMIMAKKKLERAWVTLGDQDATWPADFFAYNVRSCHNLGEPMAGCTMAELYAGEKKAQAALDAARPSATK